MSLLRNRLGFGTSHLHRLPSANHRQAILREAYDAGLRHFDTARLYGYGIAELELGRFIAGRRHEIILASKVGYRFPFFSFNSRPVSIFSKILSATEKMATRHLTGDAKPDYVLERRDFTMAFLRRSLSASLDALRTDYLDTLLLHEFDPSICDYVHDIMEWFTKLKSDGVIRAFGIAGEQNRCIATYTRFPELCEVIQASDNYHGGLVGPCQINGCRPNITYGYFRGVRLDPHGLHQRIEFALRRNPEGMVLFSSTKIKNIRTFVRAFRASESRLSGAAR